MNSWKLQQAKMADQATVVKVASIDSANEPRLYNSAEVNELILRAAARVQNGSATTDGIRSQIASLVSGGYDFADTLHNIYIDYGYPCELSFFNFWNMYRRLGIAKNVVNLIPDTVWMTPPEITEASDRFNREFESIVERLNFWHRLKGQDTRQRVGRYAGMFMRVKDGKSPDQPLDMKLGGTAALVEMMPLYESQLKVLTTQDDPKADDFGMPTMYQFSSGETGNRDPHTRGAFSIHPSRIVIAAEGADNGGIYGISALEAPYNSLMDLRKIIGGGGEGFYKNAAQSIIFETDDMASAAKNKDLLDKFNENYDEFSANRSRRAMWTPGLKANAISSDLISPKEFFNVAVNDVAASVPVPVTILIGQQTGRLASDQDSRAFLASQQSRRVNFNTEQVRNTIDWMIEHGILPESEYEVEWDDLLALSQTERLTNTDAMASVNEKQFKSGGGPVFDEEEMREAAGFDPEELPEPNEDLNDGDLDDE